MNITLRYFVNILFQYPVNIFQVFCEYSFPSISSKKLATGQSGTVKDLWGHVCQKHFVQFQLFDVPFSFSYCVDDTSEPAAYSWFPHFQSWQVFFTFFRLDWVCFIFFFFFTRSPWFYSDLAKMFLARFDWMKKNKFPLFYWCWCGACVFCHLSTWAMS